MEVAKENYSATEFWYELNPVPPGGVLNMVRPQGLKGRYVYLNIDYTDEIGATTKLTLCEVEVYGTAEGMYIQFTSSLLIVVEYPSSPTFVVFEVIEFGFFLR